MAFLPLYWECPFWLVFFFRWLPVKLSRLMMGVELGKLATGNLHSFLAASGSAWALCEPWVVEWIDTRLFRPPGSPSFFIVIYTWPSSYAILAVQGQKRKLFTVWDLGLRFAKSTLLGVEGTRCQSPAPSAASSIAVNAQSWFELRLKFGETSNHGSYWPLSWEWERRWVETSVVHLGGDVV